MRFAFFFVLVAACAEDESADNRYLELRLPLAAAASEEPADPWIVNLDRHGRCMVRGRWARADQVADLVGRARNSHGSEQHVLLRVDERTPWKLARALYVPMARASHCRLHFATRATTKMSRGPAHALLADLPGDGCCYPDGSLFGRALLIRAGVIERAGRWMFRIGDREPSHLERLRADVELFVRNTREPWDFCIAQVLAPDEAPTGAAIALAGALRACGARHLVFRPDWGPRSTGFSYIRADRQKGRICWYADG